MHRESQIQLFLQQFHKIFVILVTFPKYPFPSLSAVIAIPMQGSRLNELSYKEKQHQSHSMANAWYLPDNWDDSWCEDFND